MSYLSSKTDVVLNHKDDWEKWYDTLRLGIPPHLWPLFDPETEQTDDEALAAVIGPEPQLPESILAQTSHYPQEDDRGDREPLLVSLEKYRREVARWDECRHEAKKCVLDVRTWLNQTMGPATCPYKKITMTTKECIASLAQDFKLSDNDLGRKAYTHYKDVLEDFDVENRFEWLDKWLLAVQRLLRYGIHSGDNSMWLWELAEVLKTTYEPMAMALAKQHQEGKEQYDMNTNYRPVYGRLRMLFQLPRPYEQSGPSGMAIQPVNGAEEGQEARRYSRNRGRKRRRQTAQQN